jgi:putative FmdB family regulatory protein
LPECPEDEAVPTYQYVCTECGEPLEAVQSFSDDALTTCPVCGGQLRKVFSAVGVVFKGTGFYRNDSRTASGSKSAGSSGSEGSSSSSDSSSSRSESGKGESGKGESGKGEKKSSDAKASSDRSSSTAKPAATSAKPSGSAA